jgi:integrase
MFCCSPGPYGKPLSDTTIRKYLQKDMKQPNMTIHGFRSTFREWVAESTKIASEIAEAALAQVVGNKTEAVYGRGDALERRRKLMEMWAKFWASGATSTG